MSVMSAPGSFDNLLFFQLVQIIFYTIFCPSNLHCQLFLCPSRMCADKSLD